MTLETNEEIEAFTIRLYEFLFHRMGCPLEDDTDLEMLREFCYEELKDVRNR